MIERYNEEGKTKEEALKKICKTLQVDEQDLFLHEYETEGSLFKTKKIGIEAILKTDVITYIKEFIDIIGKYMNLSISYEIKEKDDYINVLLVSNNNAILIGKEGKNLNALQTILRQSLKKMGPFSIKVSFDASNYKAKRANNLEYEIKKIAKEVLKTKIEVKLDPMNSYERRVVHTIASTFEKLETISEGQAPDRYVVIRYQEK